MAETPSLPTILTKQLLADLWQQTMNMGGGWVLELDIRKFFDTLEHSHLRKIIRQRVQDGVLLRLIGKWLNAGVLESGCLTHPDAGSPQGGVISPLLANAYLHEVLDTWFEQMVKPVLKGHAFLIRYADDAVMVFREESDARRVLAVLPKRFGKYGLTLHPEKTRLVQFKQPRGRDPQGPPPGTFDLLGFTHFWGLSRKGNWVVKRKTARDRFTRALDKVTAWCQKNRHLPLKEQWQALGRKLSGHFGYYGITGNSRMLSRFGHLVRGTWRKWLSRRSQHGRLSWAGFQRLLADFPLPAPTIRPVLVL